MNGSLQRHPHHSHQYVSQHEKNDQQRRTVHLFHIPIVLARHALPKVRSTALVQNRSHSNQRRKIRFAAANSRTTHNLYPLSHDSVTARTPPPTTVENNVALDQDKENVWRVAEGTTRRPTLPLAPQRPHRDHPPCRLPRSKRFSSASANRSLATRRNT